MTITRREAFMNHLSGLSIATIYKTVVSRIIFSICTICLFFISSHAFAQTNYTTHTLPTNQHDKPITVYFLNGIFTTEIRAENSAVSLFHRLKDNPEFRDLIMNNQVKLKTLYNPTDPWGGDVYELFAQVKIQNMALKATEDRIKSENLAAKYDAQDLQEVKQAILQQEIYRANQMYQAQWYSGLDFVHAAGNRVIEHYQKLAGEVKQSLLAGDRVIIVAYSQGNYIVQGLYAQIMQDTDVQKIAKNKLKVVGVANVAATTPSQSYITNSDDKAVYLWHKMQGGIPMVANFDAMYANGKPLSGLSLTQMQNDSQNHGFVETYLSARFDTEYKFVPHAVPIIERNTTGKQNPIYQEVVNKVMSGIHQIQKAS